MISLGAYIIQAHRLKMDPDSEVRHEVVKALTPYWCAEQREKLTLLIPQTKEKKS